MTSRSRAKIADAADIGQYLRIDVDRLGLVEGQFSALGDSSLALTRTGADRCSYLSTTSTPVGARSACAGFLT